MVILLLNYIDNVNVNRCIFESSMVAYSYTKTTAAVTLKVIISPSCLFVSNAS